MLGRAKPKTPNPKPKRVDCLGVSGPETLGPEQMARSIAGHVLALCGLVHADSGCLLKNLVSVTMVRTPFNLQ